MLLVVIAHRGEANEFIRRKHNLPIEFYFPGLYRSDNELLLLSGTGIQSVQKKVTLVCSYFGRRIRLVVNLGIAGALDKNLEINQIYAIRNVYHESLPDCFTSFNSRSTHDCVTALNDVLNDRYAQILSQSGHIVDRELWAIASVCSQFDLRFRAYKLISDIAGSSAVIQDIIAQRSLYSKHLFDFYTKLKLTNSVLLKA